MELLAQLRSLLAPARGVDPQLREAIERGVSLADPLIKAVPRYEHKLAASVREAVAYCTRLAGDIPGPIDINAQVFGANPLVHAFFSGPEQIADMLGRSQAVRDFLAEPAAGASGEFFALLGMRRHERKVMGAGMLGDAVRREVPQTLLYFSDHTLLELSADMAQTRSHIVGLAFDSLAKSFAAKLEELRAERQALHTQWELARAAGEAVRLRELEAGLGELSERLAPERVLAAYLDWLADPAAKLRLDQVTLCVDRLGVLADPAAAPGDGEVISFPELFARDRRRWILMLVRIGREEAARALTAAHESTRYLLI